MTEAEREEEKRRIVEAAERVARERHERLVAKTTFGGDTGATKSRIPSARKKQIAARFGWVCWLCGGPTQRKFKNKDLTRPTIDHVQPLSLGGTDADENLRLAHGYCNETRGNMEPSLAWALLKTFARRHDETLLLYENAPARHHALPGESKMTVTATLLCGPVAQPVASIHPHNTQQLAQAEARKADVSWMKAKMSEVAMLLRDGHVMDAHLLARAVASLPGTIRPTLDPKVTDQFITNAIEEAREHVRSVPTAPVVIAVPTHLVVALTEDGSPRTVLIDHAGYSRPFAEAALKVVMRTMAGPSGYHAILGSFSGTVTADVPQAFSESVATLADFLGDAPFDSRSEPRLIDRLADIDEAQAEQLGRAAMERHFQKFMPRRKSAA